MHLNKNERTLERIKLSQEKKPLGLCKSYKINNKQQEEENISTDET